MFADFFTTLHFAQPFPSPGQAQQGVTLTTPHHIDEAGYGDGEPQVQRLRHTTKKNSLIINYDSDILVWDSFCDFVSIH